MGATYTLNSYGNMAVRSSDGATVPWDTVNDRPADMAGLAGRIWVEDGSPPAISYRLSLTEMVAALSGAATTAASFILNQVAPDQPHLVAYQNAAAVAAASGGAPPTVDPLKTAFAAQAASFGYTPADFATLTIGVSAASMSLSAALATLQGAAAEATTAAELATALTNFENAIAGLVTSLNGAGLKVTVQAPAAISIPGINA